MARRDTSILLELQQLLIDHIDDCTAKFTSDEGQPCIIYHDPSVGRLYIRVAGNLITASIGRDGLRSSVANLPVYISGHDLAFYEGRTNRLKTAAMNIMYRRARAYDFVHKTNTFREMVDDQFYL